MSKAWIYQKKAQVEKLGADKAPWYVGWREPDGRQKGKQCGAKRDAVKLRDRRHSELVTGTYQMNTQKTWDEFRRELEEKVFGTMTPQTRRITVGALDNFTRIAKPLRVHFIRAQHIAEFVAERSKEHGVKRDSLISVATVNKELRHLKAVLRIANDWKYLPELPRFKMLREPVQLPTYVTGEHFAAMYRACQSARLPRDVPNVVAADWWRGLLVFAYMTGWRINEILSLRRDDLDLEGMTAITRAENNKGRRDERIDLNPALVEQLRRLAGFTPIVFPWHYNQRTLYEEFARIQEAAGIHLPCNESHAHTRFCHLYGFHDLRRAFATMNADRLTGDSLQALMRHKSYQTTQRYINMTSHMKAAVAGLHVPECLASVATR